MRLLYVCSDFGIVPSGVKGASIHLRAITAALAARGCDVALLSPRPGPDADHAARRLLPPGCPLVDELVKPLKRWMAGRGLGDALPRDLRGLCYSAWAPDVALKAIATGDGPGPQAVIERMSLFSTVGMDIAEALEVPLILEVNAILTDEAESFRTLHLRDLATEIEHRVFERADAILAVSRELKQGLVARGVPEQKVHIVPNGADAAFFELRHDAKATRSAIRLDGEFTVGFVGSLKPWHGVDLLLRAFARLTRVLSGARLLIVGTGPEEEKLQTLAVELGIAGAVHFRGAVEHREVAPLVGAMDVAVAPFRSMAGFYFSPIKLFEYMAAERCIVASRLGQIESVIAHGEDGLLVAPDDETALFEALESLAALPHVRRALGEGARTKARAHFTWGHAADAVLDVVTEAVAQRKARLEDRALDGIVPRSK